ncbi:hypothetical protein [Aliikangiella maris]|uniref:HEAT repeat domain-containing protein n=2 Tax=Aliikangiella maris TaxID=3162458 RepID=A0ABV3MS10_9GAMM
MIEYQKNLKPILKSFGYNPLEAIEAGDNQSIPSGRHIFEDALKVLEMYGVDLLIPLLKSENSNTVTNALHVFSELGRKGEILIDDVVPYLDSEDESARWYVLDGLLSHLVDLPIQYIVMGLKTANDESTRVRKKAVEFISALSINKIKAAQKFLQEQLEQHKKGLDILSEPTKGECLLDKYLDDERVFSCYLFAKIIKQAKLGELIEIKDNQITDTIVEFVVLKLELLKKRVKPDDKYD